MRRTWIILWTALGLGGSIALGLLGFRNANGSEEAAPEAPPTVAVEVGDVLQTVNAPGQLVGMQEILLGMGADGPVAEIFVHPGDIVETDQLLAQLANKEELAFAVAEADKELTSTKKALQDIFDNAPLVSAQAQWNLAKAQEELQQAKYKSLIQQEGHRAGPETLAAAQAKLTLAEDEVRRAEKEYSKLSGRPEDNPVRAAARLRLAEARQRRDAAQTNLNWYSGHPTDLQQAILDAEIAIAEAKLLQAELAWERVKDGPDAEALAQAEARIADSQAKLAKAEAELAGSDLHAPFAGVILEVNARAGDDVTAGAGFIFLSDIHSLEAVTTVIEEDFPLIKVGQSAVLYFDACPDVEGSGQVRRIVPTRLPGERPLFAVYISLDEQPEGLAPGMTTDGSIIITRRENVLRLPKSLLRSPSDGTAEVEVWVEDHREGRTVQVGLRGDSYAEIQSGLQVGDLVIAE